MKFKTQIWNTGRQYTDYGQVIYAKAKQSNAQILMFADVSRKVHGSFGTYAKPLSEASLRTMVMRVYDNNSYVADADSQKFFELCQREFNAGQIKGKLKPLKVYDLESPNKDCHKAKVKYYQPPKPTVSREKHDPNKDSVL